MTDREMMRRRMADRAAKIPRCKWKCINLEEEWNDLWEGECGIEWYFEDEGNPRDNGVNFCPKCGRRLEYQGIASARLDKLMSEIGRRMK